MNRRGAITRLTILSGAALVATTGILNGCGFGPKKRTELTDKDIPLLDEIGDTIIPTTASSQGAKAAQIGAFMVTMVNDCYTEKQKAAFIAGLDAFDAACKKQYKNSFLELAQADKKKFLQQLNAEANQTAASKNTFAQPQEHYFNMLKQLTIQGYFTSKIGATMARRYEAVPGRFAGCIPYKKGDRVWATS